MIALPWPNAPHTYRVAPLISQLLLVETQAHTFLGNQHKLVVAVRELCGDQAIALLDLNRDNATFAHVSVVGKIRFFDDPGERYENDVEVFVPCLIDSARSGS